MFAREMPPLTRSDCLRGEEKKKRGREKKGEEGVGSRDVH